MAIILNDNDKLIIIAIAATLILLTLLVTICVVCPWCPFHRCILKSKQKKKALKTSYPTIANQQNPESQLFHFSIVPVYGTKTHLQTPTTPSSDNKQQYYQQQYKNHSYNNGHPHHPILNNQFEHLTNLAKLRYSLHSNNDDNNNKNDQISSINVKLPKLEATIYYQSISVMESSNINNNESSNIRIHMAIHRVFDLSINELSIEPSPYVVAILTGGYRLQRKSLVINKVLQNEMFRTETIKRTLDSSFIQQKQFISEPLSKNILKDAVIKLRLMHDERYANDICLGEISIPLKKIQSFQELKQRSLMNKNVDNFNNNENSDNKDSDSLNNIGNSNNNNGDDDIESNLQFQSNIYTLFPIKETKAELMVGLCYLPTSRRVNITIIKGTIRNSIFRFIDQSIPTSNHQAFYIKALMFLNGKLIKKKKTSSSIRLAWGKDEIISFDLLPEESSEQMSLMLILAYKMQDSNSPESPDSPENPQPPTLQSSSVKINHNKQSNTNSTLPSITSTITSNKNIINDNHNNNNNNNINNQKTSKNSPRNSLRKESYIGHFILDRQTWIEILRKPRRQIIKWYKLH